MESTNLSSHFFSDENDAKKQLQEAIEPLVQRSHEDPEFKAEFMANPREVIERETEITLGELPAKYHFVVVDKSDPYGLYITIPVNEDMLELTDEELELVAGGASANGFLCGLNIFKCGKKKAE